MEGHYRNTAGFREHFMRGSVKYGVPIDDFYSARLTAPAATKGATVRG